MEDSDGGALVHSQAGTERGKRTSETALTPTSSSNSIKKAEGAEGVGGAEAALEDLEGGALRTRTGGC